MNKKVFISGITGQDGSYMADYLIENTDCDIIGGIRRLSVPNHKNIKHLKSNPRLTLVPFDLTDSHSVEGVIKEHKPDYFINFGANSYVANSWQMPESHMLTNCMGVLHILESIRKYSPATRLYSAGSSEQWGDVLYSPQDEKHPYRPRSVYGVSKCCADYLVKVYKESYNLFAIHGLLLNHESSRRGDEFVSQVIAKNVAKTFWQFKNNQEITPWTLGNVLSYRDWSHAKDFVKGIWLMLNNSVPQSYILSSNETHSVKELVSLAFKFAGIDGKWKGDGLDAVFYIENLREIPTILVKIDPNKYRPADVEYLHGDSSLARKELHWQPEYTFEMLVKEMVDEAIKTYSSENF